HPHTFTCHIDVNTGTGGFVNAPAGTSCTVTKVSGPGTISGSPGLTSGTTGSCTVSDVSQTVGIDEVKASTTVTVLGVPLQRSTTTIANPTPTDCLSPNTPGFDATKC